MQTTERRIAALEQAQDDGIEIIRIGEDGVARDGNGQPLPPGWEKGERVITIVRSYGRGSETGRGCTALELPAR